MISAKRFIFKEDFTDSYGDIIIPSGTTGTVTFDGSKVHISCEKIVKEQGTAWFTLRFEQVKHVLQIIN